MDIFKQMFAASVVMISVGCGGAPVETLPSGGARKVENVPLTFETIKKEILTPQCIRCHSNFANYSDVAGSAQFILESVNSDRMPKGAPPLSDDLKELLASWIEIGAPL